jgi:hypothetical protein
MVLEPSPLHLPELALVISSALWLVVSRSKKKKKANPCVIYPSDICIPVYMLVKEFTPCVLLMMVHPLAKEIVSRRFSSSVNVYTGEGIILALYYDGIRL